MNTVVIYRKDIGQAKPRKASKAKADAVRTELARTTRVQRDALVSLILAGDFHRLPALTQAQIDSHVDRRFTNSDAGWAIPASDLGRCKGEPDHSTGQSILLWIKKNLEPHGIVLPGEVAVVLEDR